MSRRLPVLPALTAVGALTLASALLATGAAAAGQRHGAVSPGGAHPSAGVATRGGAMARSVGLFGDGLAFQVATGVMGRRPHKSALLVLPDVPYAAAVNPVRGKDGLLCDASDHVYPVKGLRTAPRITGSGIDASGYLGEGGPGYNYYCFGVAMHGSVALATGDSQGLLQLVRKDGRWAIDARVHFPGLNDAGQPHLPGWIAFPSSPSGATTFDAVAIAPRPMANGKRLAVAIDRDDSTVVVVAGVGSARPRVLGSLSATALGGPLRQGTGGLAFLPSSPDRALVATTTGFAVLNLHQPSDPRLKVRTTVGDGSVPPSSITVSSDSRHLAVAAGDRIYGYRGVLAATKGRPFRKQTSFTVNASDEVRDVVYTANDTLVVLHGAPAAPTDWFLTLIKKVPLGHHLIRGSTPATDPLVPGTLSVWPAP